MRVGDKFVDKFDDDYIVEVIEFVPVGTQLSQEALDRYNIQEHRAKKNARVNYVLVKKYDPKEEARLESTDESYEYTYGLVKFDDLITYEQHTEEVDEDLEPEHVKVLVRGIAYSVEGLLIDEKSLIIVAKMPKE